MTVTPVMLTCERRRTPARNSVPGPITQNGPTSTSSASFAPLATRDDGSIRGTSDLCDHRAKLGLGDDLAINLGLAAEPPHVLAPLDAIHVVLEPVTGHDWPAEFGLVYRKEIDQRRLHVTQRADAQGAGGLR